MALTVLNMNSEQKHKEVYLRERGGRKIDNFSFKTTDSVTQPCMPARKMRVECVSEHLIYMDLMIEIIRTNCNHLNHRVLF